VTQRKIGIIAQIYASEEAYVTLGARLGIVPSLLNTVTLKSVVNNVVGSLVEGRM
jgi:hypothetical protein